MANTELYGHDPTLPAIAGVTATMNGHNELFEGPDFVSPYTPDYTDRSTQRGYLCKASYEARDLDYAPRTIRGPHHAVFNELIKDVDTRMRNIDSTLTPDHLMPAGYRTKEVGTYLDEHPREKNRLDRLREDRMWKLRYLGGEIYEAAPAHELPAGLLDVPPHHWQGETVNEDTAVQLCVNACFRMIHHDLVGWAPDEDILAGVLTEQHGGLVIADNEYFKIFQTPAFKEQCDRTIKVVEVLGADFATINKLTTGVKAKYPDAKVYAMVSLGSENAFDKSVWHTNILRHTEDDDVICRDPSTHSGSSRKLMYTRNFMQRWAIAYNRVQMVIAI